MRLLCAHLAICKHQIGNNAVHALPRCTRLLLRSHQASDHYTARLTQVLADLTGEPTTEQQAQEEEQWAQQDQR